MIAKDRLGNTIREGDLLYWVSHNLVVKVKDLNPGIDVAKEITSIKGKHATFAETTKARAIIEIVLEFESKPEVIFGDCVKCVDPQSEEVVSQFLQ